VTSACSPEPAFRFWLRELRYGAQRVLIRLLSALFLCTIGFGAAAFGRWFRIYSIITLIVALVFGALTGMASTSVQANQPTPRLGVWQRINIGLAAPATAMAA